MPITRSKLLQIIAGADEFSKDYVWAIGLWQAYGYWFMKDRGHTDKIARIVRETPERFKKAPSSTCFRLMVLNKDLVKSIVNGDKYKINHPSSWSLDIQEAKKMGEQQQILNHVKRNTIYVLLKKKITNVVVNLVDLHNDPGFKKVAKAFKDVPQLGLGFGAQQKEIIAGPVTLDKDTVHSFWSKASGKWEPAEDLNKTQKPKLPDNVITWLTKTGFVAKKISFWPQADEVYPAGSFEAEYKGSVPKDFDTKFELEIRIRDELLNVLRKAYGTKYMADVRTPTDTSKHWTFRFWADE